MGYLPRYKFNWRNELNQLCEIYLDTRDNVLKTGVATFIAVTDSHFIYSSSVANLDLAAGNYIDFGSGFFPITDVGDRYQESNEYDVYNNLTGGLDGATYGTFPYTIVNALSFVAPVLETYENIVTCDINCTGDEGKITDPIITRSLQFSVNLPPGSSIGFDTFLESNNDDFACRMYVDGVPVFQGFLVPDTNSIPFQDKPYDITLQATDGLKLLSKKTLLRVDTSEFNSQHTLLEYIISAIAAAGNGLGFKMYCNIYYTPMKNRSDGIQYDMFQQACLDYRGFMTSSTAFVDCYTALQILFNKNFRCYYDAGFWIIERLAENQYLPEGNRYYTEYDSGGNVISGFINTNDFGKIGKVEIVRAIEENQILTANLANKSVKTSFNYNIWDEIPRNNKFERRKLDISAANTSATKYFIADNWVYGRQNSPTGLPVPSAGTSAKAWVKSTYNAQAVELTREIQLQAGASDSGFAKMFRSDKVPVDARAKIKLSFNIRLSNTVGVPGNYLAARVYIITPGGTKYFLDDPKTETVNSSHVEVIGAVGPWVTNFVAISALYSSGTDSQDYLSVEVPSAEIPEDGDLYVHFIADATGGSDVYIKDFLLEYTPFISGGYIPVKGDYIQRTQTARLPDIDQHAIEISDSFIAAGKGTILYGNTDPRIKTIGDWYVFGDSKHKSYKDLINLGIYNLTYRRFKIISGTFDGTTYVNNNDDMQYPISFLSLYKFMDWAGSGLFKLIPPLKIDYIKGRFDGNFQEVKTTDADGTQEASQVQFKYIFE